MRLKPFLWHAGSSNRVFNFFSLSVYIQNTPQMRHKSRQIYLCVEFHEQQE